MIPSLQGAQPVSPAADRINYSIYALSNITFYLIAPVTYVGVVQAALCDKLGATTTVSNLPASMYLFGFFAPLFAAAVVPPRLERQVAAAASGFAAVMLGLVAVTLLLPVRNDLRIAAIVGQGCMIGISASISQVFLLQCLCRGTTPEGKARAFKLSFGLGPLAAVLGSLAAQYMLNGNIRAVQFPSDFGFLYVFGAICMALVSVTNLWFKLPPAGDAPRLPILSHLWASIRSFASDRTLLRLWFSYLLWFSAISAIPNFSLYTKETLHRDPKDLSGIIMALRFGCKALTGFYLGGLSLRRGARAAVIATVVLTVAGTFWAASVPGYPYLLAFGLMGAGELGGAYYPNYVVTVSPLSDGAGNQAILAFATPAASFAPALHGFLTARYGFLCSFMLGALASLAALLLALRLPRAGCSVTAPPHDKSGAPGPLRGKL